MAISYVVLKLSRIFERGGGRICPPSGARVKDLKILKLDDLVHSQILNIMHDFLRGELPHAIAVKFTLNAPCRPSRIPQHFSERNRSIITGDVIPNYKLHKYRQFSMFCRAPSLWNSIVAKNIPNINDVPFSPKSFFKKVVKLILIDSY